MSGWQQNVQIGEANKLVGISNYYVWSLKIRAILRKGLWVITENLVKFPTIVVGEHQTELTLTALVLRKKKAAAMSFLTLSISDLIDLIDFVVVHMNPEKSFVLLRSRYQSSDQLQILSITS
uniref:DUF4219 domain-containing protein n=1 Tax=Physcomitrium patens TaxID=3218 RepID=A0A2K1IW41_PHYPA|nr:hypothetical protein PHYPA_025438 [Physcomitrium patens]